jgi:hypothetical protein
MRPFDPPMLRYGGQAQGPLARKAQGPLDSKMLKTGAPFDTSAPPGVGKLLRDQHLEAYFNINHSSISTTRSTVPSS